MSDERKPCWIITPHKDSGYDCCVVFIAGDHSHAEALHYAQDVLEQLWDDTPFEDGEPVKFSVTMELSRLAPIDVYEADFFEKP
jgi:hypothetical protein